MKDQHIKRISASSAPLCWVLQNQLNTILKQLLNFSEEFIAG